MKRIAIVYDWFDSAGGVERILKRFHEIFPEAVFFTSFIDRQSAHWAKGWPVQTSFLQFFPGWIRKNRFLTLLFYPYIFESFDLQEFDVVISVTAYFAKAVITRPHQKHICYLLTPPRFLWKSPWYFQPWQERLLAPLLSRLRQWDKVASQKPDKIVSISKTVADRCLEVYGRESDVVYPPLDAEYWNELGKKQESGKSTTTKKHFLCVSRLEQYKRIDLAIKAFERLPAEKLIIVGSGRESRKLRRLAGKNVVFKGWVSDRDLPGFYQGAKALIMPQEEDFGYVALEALYFGCPVICYGRGGATEIITHGENGLYFLPQTAEALVGSLETFRSMAYNLDYLKQKDAEYIQDKWSLKRFEEKWHEMIDG